MAGYLRMSLLATVVVVVVLAVLCAAAPNDEDAAAVADWTLSTPSAEELRARTSWRHAPSSLHPAELRPRAVGAADKPAPAASSPYQARFVDFAQYLDDLQPSEAHMAARRAAEGSVVPDAWWCGWYGGCDPLDSLKVELTTDRQTCESSFDDLAGTGYSCGAAKVVTCLTDVFDSTEGISSRGAPRSCEALDEDGNRPSTSSPARYIEVTAAVNGYAYATTCSPHTTFDTKVTVYEGSCSSMECVADEEGLAMYTADDDESCFHGTTRSSIKWPAKRGRSYWVRVWGYGGESGKYHLRLGGSLRRGEHAPVLVQQASQVGLRFHVGGLGLGAEVEPVRLTMSSPSLGGERLLAERTPASLPGEWWYEGAFVPQVSRAELSINVPPDAAVERGTFHVRWGSKVASVEVDVLRNIELDVDMRLAENAAKHKTEKFRSHDYPCPTPPATPNDRCETAHPVSCYLTMGDFSTSAPRAWPFADMNSDSSRCGTSTDSGKKWSQMWYKVRGTGGQAEASLCEASAYTYPRPKVAVFKGSCGGGLECVGYSYTRENCGGSRYKSWFAEEGVDYYIMLNGQSYTTPEEVFRNEFGLRLRGAVEGEGGLRPWNELVVRRGDSFDVQATFSAQLTSEEQQARNFEHLTVALQFVDLPDEPVPVSSSAASDGSWSYTASVMGEGASVNLRLHPPVNAMVGKYVLKLSLPTGEEAAPLFYVIFNPYHADDQVYMADEVKRGEYVESEVGMVWTGSSDDNGPQHWANDQYNYLSLTVALDGLVGLSAAQRRDAIHVTRQMSLYFGNTILHGRWKDTFPDGIEPWKWTGTYQLLHNWHTTRPSGGVRYAQCWVFAGVMTTIHRALGVPVRTVTNFESAHESPKCEPGAWCPNGRYHQVVEEYQYPKDGYLYRIPDNTADSIWNFHVWNDVWIKRPDLEGTSAAQWNAVDATPQESSTQSNLSQMGPASHEYLMARKYTGNYDVDFCGSEVDADRQIYDCPREGASRSQCSKGTTQTRSVGVQISTKAVGAWELDDVTLQYKPSQRRDRRRVHTGTALAFDFRVEKAGAGDAMVAVVEVYGQPSRELLLDARVRVDATTYTGEVLHEDVHKSRRTLPLLADDGEFGADSLAHIRVPIDDAHLRHVALGNHFRLSVAVYDALRAGDAAGEHGELLFATFGKVHARTELAMVVNEGAPVERASFANVRFSFRNFLPTRLENLTITLHGNHYMNPRNNQLLAHHPMEVLVDSLEAGDTLDIDGVMVTPLSVGETLLSAVLHSGCGSLRDVQGAVIVHVVEPPPLQASVDAGAEDV